MDELKKNLRELFNKNDIMGIVLTEYQEDEYDNQISDIVSYLELNKDKKLTVTEMNDKLKEIFCKWFSVESTNKCEHLIKYLANDVITLIYK